ncbi:5-hydroxytryptamine receptor 3E-like isoform X2 [Gouania willdenowi]|uniref:5-hydroxytryptamine receptor 3E-like isoform X2 n=1 Tax=Gouania willdenowi TaxID=441366 RepID=UPI0010559F78|nr:5-hydroxytryptamine receptor 3E-like isoform X2 [Gouania willdenowi]
MKRVIFLLLVILAVAASSQICSYQDILDYLNLTTDNSVFRLTRPVLDHTRPTVVHLDVYLYAILSVIEKTQTFVPFVWCSMRWINERIKWDPAHFCGIDRVSIPHEMVWKPDLFIYEMIEKDDSPKSPYLFLYNDGSIFKEEGLRIVSACNMDVHKFPFDTQKCNISIGSTLHCSEGLKCLKRTNKKLYHVFSFFLSLILSPPSTVDELLLQPFSNSSRATQFSKELIRIHGEWEFLHLLVSKSNLSYHDRLWDQLVYTVTMRRKPLLHVLNFLLPVLFFLTLDLASFFIADHRGEKLGFKITVLLAISVLLLILNDILPSMSSRTPLIATYCIVIFGLMLLSVLVTILVTYLLEKDAENLQRESWVDGDNTVKADNTKEEEQEHTLCSCISEASDAEKQHELVPISEEVSSSIQTGETHVLLLILDELKEMQKTLRVHHSCRSKGKYAMWAARINGAFFFLYVITVSLFLPLLYMEWTSETQ